MGLRGKLNTVAREGEGPLARVLITARTGVYVMSKALKGNALDCEEQQKEVVVRQIIRQDVIVAGENAEAENQGATTVTGLGGWIIVRSSDVDVPRLPR